MSLDSMSGSDHTGSDRPVQSRETKEKLQRVKPREWVNKGAPGKIRGGMQAQIEKMFKGEQ